MIAGRLRIGEWRHGQRGFTMLEILVTLFLLTMWLLASAGVQSSSLQFTKAAQFRTQAVYLATELVERMQANKTEAVKGSYVYTGGSTASSTDCTTAACKSDALAAFDLNEWTGRVNATLPNATMSVTAAGIANPITYTILLCWTDRRTDRNYGTVGQPSCPSSTTAEAFSYTSAATIYNDPNQ